MYIYDRKFSGAQSLLKEQPITSQVAQRNSYQPDGVVNGFLGCGGSSGSYVGTNERLGQLSKAKVPLRKIILVAGAEYPRYCKDSVPAGVTGVKGCIIPDNLKGKPKTQWVLAGGRTTPERDGQQNSHWRRKCLALAQQKLKADPDLAVYLYDFDRATRERIKLEEGKLVIKKQETFSPLANEDYRWVDAGKLRPISTTPLLVKDYPKRPYIRYCPSVSKISKGEVAQSAWLKKFEKSNWSDHGLSIRHIYEHIMFIGRHFPYTLNELHLFGHASSAHRPGSGAAFINTDHVSKDKSKRDPLDLDARADSDFIASTINTKEFRMAFAEGAMSYVWGCNWHVPVFVMIRDAARALGSKPLQDATVFKFKFDDKNRHEIHPLKELAAIAGCGMWNGKTSVLEMDGKCLRKLLTYLLQNSYMQRLANASAHCVTGGLPGTFSDYDERSEKGAPKLSHIPMGGSYGTTQDFRVVMNFFAKHFGTKFNKDGAHKDFGRGFALYCPP